MSARQKYRSMCVEVGYIMRSWVKVLIKITAFIVLIPVLGIGVLFGGAYVYGQIQLRVHENRAEKILTESIDVLEKYVSGEDKLKYIKIPGIEKAYTDMGVMIFEMPYSGKPFSWVPCGLMYAEDTSHLHKWRRYRHIEGNWYFTWATG